jgi:hypothetical protein
MNLFQPYTIDEANVPDELIQVGREFDNIEHNYLVARKLRWEAFLEQYVEQEIVYYESTKSCLPRVAFSDQIFRTQTEFELQLSFAFYQALFETKNLVIISSQEAAKKLLVLSLIYSKYYSIFRCSLRHGFSTLLGTVLPQDVDKLFTLFLVRYEKPEFLISHFDLMNSGELSILIQALTGKNMKNHPVFRNKLSSADFTQLMKLHLDLRVDNSFFSRAAIFTLMKKACKDHDFAVSFVNASKIYRNNPNEYLENIGFWQRAMQLSHGAIDILGYSITNVVDYLDAKWSEGVEPNFLKRRTSGSFLRAVFNWHLNIYNTASEKFKKLSWNTRKDLLDLYFEFDNNSYRCLQLKNGQELFDEGQELEHCVVTYAVACVHGSCRIWSMQKSSNAEFIRYITIEEENGLIVQARKTQNRAINQKDHALLEEWAKRMDFELELREE